MTKKGTLSSVKKEKSQIEKALNALDFISDRIKKERKSLPK
jgi:hypothetical protein